MNKRRSPRNVLIIKFTLLSSDNMIAVSPLVSLMIDSQNVLRKVTELLLPHLPQINFGWSEGRGWNCSSIRCVLLKNIRKIRRMRKQSIPGLPSFRGWPGVEATCTIDLEIIDVSRSF